MKFLLKGKNYHFFLGFSLKLMCCIDEHVALSTEEWTGMPAFWEKINDFTLFLPCLEGGGGRCARMIRTKIEVLSLIEKKLKQHKSLVSKSRCNNYFRCD